MSSESKSTAAKVNAGLSFTMPASNPHIRVKGKDVDEMIDSNPCAQPYHLLEDCLADFDRDWRKCQKQVKALQQCNQAYRKQYDDVGSE